MATEAAAPGRGTATAAWRGIDELGALVGTYCWLENRIFELAGGWASGPGGGTAGAPEPAERVWCAGVSRRHGTLAARWFERLPVRAGIERAGLVTAPPGPLAGALEALAAEHQARAGMATLILTVLPRLQAVYEAHRRTALPASEAPVLEVLSGAQRELTGEIGGGRFLLEGGVSQPTSAAAAGPALERAFAETPVFPAVSAS